MLQGLNIHDAALGLLGCLHCCHLEHVSVFLQKFIGHVSDRTLSLHGLLGMGDAQGQNHLTLPQRNRIHQRGLNLFGHQGVIVLDHADLGTHLNGDLPGQLQVKEFLLKAVAHGSVVIGLLSILRQSGRIGLVIKVLQGGGPFFRQLLLTGQNVHGQLFEIVQVLVVHLVQQGDILQQNHLMVFQLTGNLVHIGFRLVIAGAHGLEIGGCLLEYAAQALLLFRRREALEFRHQRRDHIAQFTHVLGPDGVEGSTGEIRNILLGRCAVLQHKTCIGQVDLLCKIQYDLLFSRCQGGHVRSGFGGRFFHLRHYQFHFRGSSQIGGQGQFGNLFIHCNLSFIIIVSFVWFWAAGA